MPYEFINREEEPEPEPAGGRSGRPPRKSTAVGVLDAPPFPPKKPPSPIPELGRSAFIRIIVVLILVGLALTTAVMLWKVF